MPAINIEHIKPGSLCLDNNRLCVLVKLGTPEDAPYTRLMNQANILQPFGWFLDLKTPNIRFGTLIDTLTIDILTKSGEWVCSLFTRNLDVVEWINLDTVEEVKDAY